MEPVKVVNNFISEQECSVLINEIDQIIKKNIDNFCIYQDGKRLALQFGDDLYHGHNSYLNLDIISSSESLFRKYFLSVVGQTAKLFDEKENMYVSSFWIAKQFPGAEVPEHEDTDGGKNTHFEYSAVLYLNTLTDSGDLEFPYLNYSYSPKAGDLVVFPSRNTGTHVVNKINEDRYTLPMWITKNKDFIL
jgi:hypothetical protein